MFHTKCNSVLLKAVHRPESGISLHRGKLDLKVYTQELGQNSLKNFLHHMTFMFDMSTYY